MRGSGCAASWQVRAYDDAIGFGRIHPGAAGVRSWPGTETENAQVALAAARQVELERGCRGSRAPVEPPGTRGGALRRPAVASGNRGPRSCPVLERRAYAEDHRACSRRLQGAATRHYRGRTLCGRPAKADGALAPGG